MFLWISPDTELNSFASTSVLPFPSVAISAMSSVVLHSVWSLVFLISSFDLPYLWGWGMVISFKYVSLRLCLYICFMSSPVWLPHVSKKDLSLWVNHFFSLKPLGFLFYIFVLDVLQVRFFLLFHSLIIVKYFFSFSIVRFDFFVGWQTQLFHTFSKILQKSEVWDILNIEDVNFIHYLDLPTYFQY